MDPGNTNLERGVLLSYYGYCKVMAIIVRLKQYVLKQSLRFESVNLLVAFN